MTALGGIAAVVTGPSAADIAIVDNDGPTFVEFDLTPSAPGGLSHAPGFVALGPDGQVWYPQSFQLNQTAQPLSHWRV
jgi:hypothetical protein